MIRINAIRTEPGAGEELLKKKAASKCRINEKKILSLRVLKKSLDARKKDCIREVTSVYIETSLSPENEKKAVKRAGSKDVLLYEPVRYEAHAALSARPEKRPVIAGFGPAGIFLGLLLSMNGFDPLVIERGKRAEERKEDVERFFNTGLLDPSSNAQFGEGGAGAFSDGKLNTLVKDEKGRSRFILETLVRFGADENILYDAKPHIGTDRLIKIIPGIREEIEKNGGEVRFSTTLTGFLTEDGRLKGLIVNDSETIPADSLFLCLGHSARDTVRELYKRGIGMEAKAFAVGLRVEHQRKVIDEGLHRDRAAYKLTHKCADKRGVYSFCMCPGGYVINASSSEGMLVVNGMSYSGRSGENSNSAIVVTVDPSDYMKDNDPLRGIAFQEEMERKAFEAAKGRIPCQLYADFKKDIPSKKAGSVRPSCKGDFGFCSLRPLLPSFVVNDIIEGMEEFGKKIRGFNGDDTLLYGVESRTSSPVRILRDRDFQSTIRGIYPAGEGAGFAGGIMSAAMDGMRCAEVYMKQFV